MFNRRILQHQLPILYQIISNYHNNYNKTYYILSIIDQEYQIINNVQNKQMPKQITKQQQLKAKQKQNQNVQTFKSYRYLIALILTYCLGSFYFGYMLAYISSISFSTIRSVFNVDWELSLSQGLIIGAIPVGALIGSTTSRFLVVRFARRKIIIYTNFFALLVGGLIYIQNPYVLLFTRLGQGFCVGIYSALTPVIVHQFAPLQIAGRLGSFHQLLVFTGTFTAFLLKYICELIANDLPGKKIWYYVFGLPLITVTVQTLLLLFKFKYNTPKYLVEKHKHIAAHKVLHKIYKPQYVEEKYMHILEDVGMKLEDVPLQQRIYGHKGVQIRLVKPPGQINKQKGNLIQQNQLLGSETAIRLKDNELNKVQQQNDDDDEDLDGENQGNKQDGYKQQQILQTPRRAKLLALFIALLQRFSGINAVVAYSGQVVGKVTPDLVSIFPIIINVLPVITNFIISFFLKKFGRKPLLLFGAAVACFATALVSIGFFVSYDKNTTAGTVLIYAGQIIYMANFGFSLGPIVWLYLSQIAMQKFVPYAVAVNWVGCSIVMILFPIIKASLPYQNPAPLFIFFSAWSLLQFIVNSKFAIQTKGKNYRQIYNQFTNFKSDKQIQEQKKKSQQMAVKLDKQNLQNKIEQNVQKKDSNIKNGDKIQASK